MTSLKFIILDEYIQQKQGEKERTLSQGNSKFLCEPRIFRKSKYSLTN